MQIDNTDRALISLLTENARLPVATLARKLGLARTTVQARLERLETTGAIAGYTIRQGADIRDRLRATVLISVEPRSQPHVLARLQTMAEVRHVSTTSGRFDLIAILGAATTETLDAALDNIGDARGVRSSESLIHLSTKIDRA